MSERITGRKLASRLKAAQGYLELCAAELGSLALLGTKYTDRLESEARYAGHLGDDIEKVRKLAYHDPDVYQHDLGVSEVARAADET